MTPLEVLSTYTGPPDLTAVRGLTTWTFDLGGLLIVLALGVPYVVGRRRVRRAGLPWPAGRVVAYALGLLVVLVATMSFLGAYSYVLFWVTSVQVALLLTVAPVLLSLGAPVSLLTEAWPGTRPAVDRLLGTPPVRLLTFPVVAAAVVAAVPFLVYWTPFFEATRRHHGLTWLLQVGVLAAGLLFFWPVLAVDREPVLPFAALAVVVLMETLVDSVPGIVLWLSTTPMVGGYYLHVGRPWGRSVVSDQQFGGVMLWGIGELVGLPLLFLVVARWVRADAREAARIDAELDLEDERRSQQPPS
jgi:cytochrome c oxidase assembly factor CtaG